MSNKIVARTLLHACYVKDVNQNDDGLVVSEIVEHEDGTVRPNLRRFKNPTVPFWITQPSFRNHTDKKEFEKIERLDVFHKPYKEKDREIFNALNGYYPNFLSNPMRRELYQSPYLYGGNISIEALVAMKYKKDLLEQGRVPHTPTTGFFDIEQSLLPSSFGALPLMVFIAENQVYLTMKRSFMFEERNGQHVDVTVEDIEKAAHAIIDPLVNSIFDEKGTDLSDYRGRLPFRYHFHVGDSEVEMIRWIFGKMHESKTSFIGVWNLGFDIPEIMKILKDNDIPLSEIFADPSLQGTGFDYASYREDKRDVAHFTQKWHWLTNSAHFQFVDSMALYSYIRIVNGKESSYALDDILKGFGLGGKLKLIETVAEEGTPDWHREMLSKYFTYYALYCIWDGMSLQILEWLNNDLTAMLLLGDTTPGKFFVNQTIRVTNDLYERWLKEKWVLGTGVDVEGIRDDDFLSAGGAVLEPQHLVAPGLCLFEEWPHHPTNCFAWQNDLDFSAQYPTNVLTLNISKQSKIATMIKIVGSWVKRSTMVEIRRDKEGKSHKYDMSCEVFGSYLVTPNCSGFDLGTEFFNLPGYDELDELFQLHLEASL